MNAPGAESARIKGRLRVKEIYCLLDFFKEIYCMNAPGAESARIKGRLRVRLKIFTVYWICG